MARTLRFLIAPVSRIPSSCQRSALRTVHPNHLWLVACLLCGVSFTGCWADDASSPKSGRADAKAAALPAAPVPTHVLTAMGVPETYALGTVRFSLGRENTADEVDAVAALLPRLVARLRSLAAV